MYYSKRTHLMRYSMLFAGLCMVVQPIGCINISESLKTLYAGLPSMPYKKNVTDFFSSKYGLGIVAVGGTALATLLLARMWYASRQQQETEEQSLQQRIQTALSQDNIKDIIEILDDLYGIQNWELVTFSKKLISSLGDSTINTLLALADAIAKYNQAVHTALANERQYIVSNKLDNTIRARVLMLIDTLMKQSPEVQSREQSVSTDKPEKRGEERAQHQGIFTHTGALPIKKITPIMETEQSYEYILDRLNDIYSKNPTWLPALASDFYSYLGTEIGLATWAGAKDVLISTLKNPDPGIIPKTCSVLEGRINMLSGSVEGQNQRQEARSLLSSLMDLLRCGDASQDAYQILITLNSLYEDLEEKRESPIDALLEALDKEGTEIEVASAITQHDPRVCKILRDEITIINNQHGSDPIAQHIISRIQALINMAQCAASE